MANGLTLLAKHCNLSSILSVCSSTCCIVSWITGACWWLCGGWPCGKGGAPDDIVDVVVEVTVGVLLALSSFLSFFSAFFLALQFSVECLFFLQKVHFSYCWLGVVQNLVLWSLPLHCLQVTFLQQQAFEWFFLPHFLHCISVYCWGWVVADVPHCCEIKDTGTLAVLATPVICKRGTHQGGVWGITWITVGGTTVSILTCVVDAKLTSVTGCICVCAVLESDWSIGFSTILTGMGFLTVDSSATCESYSRFNACVCDACVDWAPGETGSIFSIGWNALAVVTGVMDPLGVGGVDMFDVAFPSWYISDCSKNLLTEFTSSHTSDVKYSGLFCSKAVWLGWHSG